MKSVYTYSILCCLTLLLASCGTKSDSSSVGELNDVIEPISCMVVLPVRTSVDEGDALQYKEANNLKQGAIFADSILVRELAGNSKVRIIKGSQLTSLVSGISGGIAGTVAEVGKQLNCEAVLLTTMRRFKQREGGEMAVDAPASASFDMRLIRVKDKNVIWAADFNETQESLLSNILSFGKAQSRGFKWITVEDLVAQGIKERLEECPYL